MLSFLTMYDENRYEVYDYYSPIRQEDHIYIQTPQEYSLHENIQAQQQQINLNSALSFLTPYNNHNDFNLVPVQQIQSEIGHCINQNTNNNNHLSVHYTNPNLSISEVISSQSSRYHSFNDNNSNLIMPHFTCTYFDKYKENLYDKKEEIEKNWDTSEKDYTSRFKDSNDVIIQNSPTTSSESIQTPSPSYLPEEGEIAYSSSFATRSLKSKRIYKKKSLTTQQKLVHNQIEKRYRSAINLGLLRLKAVIPWYEKISTNDKSQKLQIESEEGLDSSMLTPPSTESCPYSARELSNLTSKTGILQVAADYIGYLQEELSRAREIR